jgi:hypothetical protein
MGVRSPARCSEYRPDVTFEEVPRWIDARWALERFGPDLASQQREYRAFVDAGAGITRAPWKDAVGQILIGCAQWVERMRAILESKPRSSDHPAMQRYIDRPRCGLRSQRTSLTFHASFSSILMHA